MIEQKHIARLKYAQQKYALDSMQHPSEKNEFEYGYRCGKVSGFEAAIQELLALLRDEHSDEREL